MIGFDSETTSGDLHHGGKPFFVSTCTHRGEIKWWEWAVHPLTREPIIPPKEKAEVRQYLEIGPVYEDRECPTCGTSCYTAHCTRCGAYHHEDWILWNAKFDLRALERVDIPVLKLLPAHQKWLLQSKTQKNTSIWDRVHDGILGSHCLHSAGPHGLKENALSHLDIPDDDEKELKDAANKARVLAKRLGWRVAQARDPHFPALLRAPAGSGWAVLDMWLPRALCLHYSGIGPLSKEAGVKRSNNPDLWPYPQDPECDFPNPCKCHPWWHICARYAITDAERTMGLWLVFKQAMIDEGLWEVYETRRKLLRITYDMEEYGFSLSKERTEQAIVTYENKAEEAKASAIKAADYKIDNLSSTQQLQGILYGHFKLKPVKETKTGYATDKKTLEALLEDLEPGSKAAQFIDMLTEHRSHGKSVDYLNSYLLNMIRSKIHASINITGTGTTRLSSNNPNNQNVQIELRVAFGPLLGREWFAADYSNIEMRIPAFHAEEYELMELFERGGSYHNLIASILHPEKYEQAQQAGMSFKDMFIREYKTVKNGNFAAQYDASERKQDLTYGIKGAARKIASRFKKITKLSQYWKDHAVKHGYVVTLGGYRLQVGRYDDGRIKMTTPFNYFTQGSAGWAITLAMIRVYDYLQNLPDYIMHMTIHDELDFDFPICYNPGSSNRFKNLEIIQNVKALMEKSGDDLGIPLPVDVHWHPHNWGEGKTLKEYQSHLEGLNGSQTKINPITKAILPVTKAAIRKPPKPVSIRSQVGAAINPRMDAETPAPLRKKRPIPVNRKRPSN